MYEKMGQDFLAQDRRDLAVVCFEVADTIMQALRNDDRDIQRRMLTHLKSVRSPKRATGYVLTQVDMEVSG